MGRFVSIIFYIHFANVGKMSVTLVNLPVFLFLCSIFIKQNSSE